MLKLRPFSRLLVMVLLLGPLVALAETFVVQDIRVEGLQRISAGTVFNYMPVKVGERIEAERTGEIIRSLFATGFFKDVQLKREGDVLIVTVEERPAIGEVVIEGNSVIPTEKLTVALKEIGLSEGRTFNRSVLDKIEQELQRQYFSQGYYAMTLKTDVTPLERNRVAVKLEVVENEPATIKKINIIGNKAFDEDDLLDLFELAPTGMMAWITQADQYSRQKLSGDLESLRSFYLDRGYIHFKVDSTQVSITPDKKDIYITVNISEGEVFTIADIKLAGDLPVAKEEIFPQIHLNRGDVFSRKEVLGSSNRITGMLGNSGYAFANVNPIPEINDQTHQVALTFFVDPGKRVYVQRINLSGNSNTRDEVLRREMRQMEAAWFSAEQIQLSRDRLKRLGYFEDVTIETPAVAGSADQVDVNVKVKERPAGNLMAGIGFSQSEGFIFNASVTQSNFLGTGKWVSLAFNNSQSNTEYRLGYNNPYYTIDGVSRGFDLRYRSTDFAEEDTAQYITDIGSAAVNWGIPLNEFDRIRFELRAENTDFKVGDEASNEVELYEQVYGNSFLDFLLDASWSHDTRDSNVFPTRGGLQSFVATFAIPGSDLEYYKVQYKNRHYFPLTDMFTLSLNGEVGYGDGYGDTEMLPIFQNYFAGGIRSVRGFKGHSLGPRDSLDDPLGGNLRVVGNMELLFPPPFGVGEKTVRMGAFVDAGNVFDTNRAEYDFDSGEIRYSTGISAVWMSPVGVLGISLAQPLNDEKGDDVENFQFIFGSSF